jgi:hypothetical protein
MKYLPPFALALLLPACAITPEDKQAARQHELEKQARENFIAMKAQEHPGRPVVLHDDAPPPTPRPSGFAIFGGGQKPAPKPGFHASSQPRPTPEQKVAWTPTLFASNAKPRPSRSTDDTVYFWQVESNHQHTTPREQAAEAKYARQLAKRSEDLTPEERMYAHEHY